MNRLASTMQFTAALVAFVAALALPVQAADTWGQLDVGGETRTYLVHTPPGYGTSKPLPLVIVFHGGGGSVEGTVRQSGMSAKADRENFVVVYPRGSGALKDRLLTWNAGNCCAYAMSHKIDDTAFVRALLDLLQRDYALDPKRVFATGISNGGMMSYRVACELADRIAAIAPVSGALNVDCRPTAPVSVIIFHGTADEHVLLEGGVPRQHFGPARTDRSVAYATSFWVEKNGCQVSPRAQDNGTLRTAIYSECKNGTGVTVDIVDGGGHAWPGGERMAGFLDEPNHRVSATDLMWDFFVAHPKP